MSQHKTSFVQRVNQTQPAQTPPAVPPATNRPSSLLNRTQGQQQAQAQTPAPAQNQQNGGQSQQPSPFQRLGNRPATPPAPQPAPNRGLPTRPNPFANNANNQNNNTRNWTMQPAYGTVVRFDLRGLGDPFYRLMNKELDPGLGDSRAVTKKLEEGGETVAELQTMLDEAWAKYELQGALLVYNWNAETWRQIAQPAPTTQTTTENNGNSDDFYEDDENKQQPNKPLFTCLRAIDVGLVLNVLGRSRSQLLIARAPLLFAQQYLNRSIMSDDPRLVTLAKATGYIEES